MAFYRSELGDREIRLVIIEPGERTDPLQCRVKVVSLEDDELSYEALSYHWGDPDSHDYHVLVEGERFRVQENLNSALHDLRLQDQPRSIYIDAICINQDSKAPEKGRQKAMMGQVYKQAPRVVIYVGESKEQSDLALDTILKIDEELQQQLEDGTRDSSHPWSTLDLGSTTFFQKQIALGFDATPWIAINRLLRRSWWKRVWTVPEVILPEHDMVFFCGTKSVSWPALCRVTLAIARFDFGQHWQWLHEANYSRFHALQPTIHGVREAYRAGTCDSSLLTNLVTFYHRSAGKYDHDQVYAFTSFSSDVSPDDFPIDHQCELSKLFTDVAAFFVHRQKNPKFLTLCQSYERMTKLPSWVPDWNIVDKELKQIDLELQSTPKDMVFFKLCSELSKARRPPVPLANWIGSTNHTFRAAMDGPSSIAVVQRPKDNRETRCLSIQGLIHSKVLAVGQNIFPPEQQPVWQWLSLVYSYITDPYPTGEPRLEVLWRTLITNRASNMQIAEQSLFAKAMSPEAVQWIELGRANKYARTPLGATIMQDFTPLVIRAMSGRRFFVTDNGYMGLGPADINDGDHISLLHGVEVPMILRDCSDGEKEIIGPCYCHGIMEGEGMKGDSKEETFILR